MVTYDEVDVMLQRIGKIKISPDCSITMQDIRDHDIENNFRKFAPYLLWLQEYYHDSKMKAERNACAYISQLFAKHTVDIQ